MATQPSTALSESVSSPAADSGSRNAGRTMLQKIWLPRALYTLVPFFYLLAGILALLGALYLPGWSWLLPYALLGAGMCIHAAVWVLSLRLRANHRSQS